MTTENRLPTDVYLGPVEQFDASTGNVGDVMQIISDGAAPGGKKWAPQSSVAAPASAEYVVKSADGTLTAERVLTDSTGIAWDWSVAGVVKGNVIAPVGWRQQYTITSVANNNTVDVCDIGTSEGALLVTAKATRLSYRASAMFYLPVNYTGSSPWLIARPTQANAGAQLQLEVAISNGSTALRVRNESGGTFDGLVVTVIALLDNAPTFAARTRADAAITTTALFGYERTRLDALEQNGATSNQLLLWDDTNKKWIPSGIPASGVTAGTYGSSTKSAVITIAADGRITSVAEATISGGGGGGGGGIVFLGEVVASAASAATFASLITATYDEYELTWAGLTPGTNAAVVGIQLSTDNGSTWITSGYEYGTKLLGNSTSFETYQRGTAQAVALIGTNALSSTVVSAGLTKLWRANTSERKAFVSEGVCGSSDGNTYGTFCTSSYPTATTFNAIRILATSGTITGTFRLYGRAKV